MKGKNIFTSNVINELEGLIKLRIATSASGQKTIRQKMRNLGFYSKDDWGITDLHLSDLHSLIASGKITVNDKIIKPFAVISATPTKVISKPKTKSTTAQSYLLNTLEDFKNHRFDPQLDSEMSLSNMAGSYIICLQKNSKLPNTSMIPVYTKFEDLKVIYTGIASISLRTRDYKQHFKGNNAGRSTLRKSLGALLGYKQIPRDKDHNNGKTKFSDQDEQRLSKWMHSNLIMYALPTTDYGDIEIMLINHFNPPLNLKTNQNEINLDFRQLLSKLRSKKHFNLYQ